MYQQHRKYPRTHQQNVSRDKKLDNQLRAFKIGFYPAFGLTIQEEITDKDRQIKGIDVLATGLNGETYAIDEKSSTKRKYLEHGLRTYAQELQFHDIRKNGAIKRPGWAIDPTKETTHYMLFLPRGKMAGTGRIDSISSISAYFVPKQGMKDYFASLGFSLEELLDIYTSTPPSQRFNTPSNRSQFLYITPKDSHGNFKRLKNPENPNSCIKIVQSIKIPEKSIVIPVPLEHIAQFSQTISRTYSPEESRELLRLANDPNLISVANDKVQQHQPSTPSRFHQSRFTNEQQIIAASQRNPSNKTTFKDFQDKKRDTTDISDDNG